MKEGDVVVVTAKIEDQCRNGEDADPIGTVILLEGQDCWVLLVNRNIWVGHRREVFPAKENENEETLQNHDD